jgi:hypothetical protein
MLLLVSTISWFFCRWYLERERERERERESEREKVKVHRTRDGDGAIRQWWKRSVHNTTPTMRSKENNTTPHKNTNFCVSVMSVLDGPMLAFTGARKRSSRTVPYSSEWFHFATFRSTSFRASWYFSTNSWASSEKNLEKNCNGEQEKWMRTQNQHTWTETGKEPSGCHTPGEREREREREREVERERATLRQGEKELLWDTYGNNTAGELCSHQLVQIACWGLQKAGVLSVGARREIGLIVLVVEHLLFVGTTGQLVRMIGRLLAQQTLDLFRDVFLLPHLDTRNIPIINIYIWTHTHTHNKHTHTHTHTHTHRRRRRRKKTHNRHTEQKKEREKKKEKEG